jgi:uncharacterized protein (TIGR00730 family)
MSMSADGPIVTVFGASKVGPESDEYILGLELGRLLGQHGYATCNGGYDGTMEAVAKGVKESGGRTIGVLVDSLNHRDTNPYIDEVEQTESLLYRLEKLVMLGDAFVVLPGGIGTLLEFALVWNLSTVRELEKPIVLIGENWQSTISALEQFLLIRDDDCSHLMMVATPEEAVQILDSKLKS